MPMKPLQTNGTSRHAAGNRENFALIRVAGAGRASVPFFPFVVADG